MITIEQIKEAFGDNRSPFKTENVDYDVLAISLLREKIPYEECKSIIVGADHDIVYLCDVDKAMKHLTENDLLVLADCNVLYNEDNGCFAMFV